MLKPRRETNLALKPIECGRGGPFGWQDLDDDFAAQRDLFGEEDTGHSPAAELALERECLTERVVQLLEKVGQ
jgi:hypothetical protein